MRNEIETAPKDGTFVILEDDSSGIYDVAHWLAATGQWIGKNDEPITITPTHWHPLAHDNYFLLEGEGPDDRATEQIGRASCRERVL